MRVLLLSAYEAQSHRCWQNALQSMFDGWQWTVLSLPPRYFSWRVRGNPLFWSVAERDVLEAGYDVLIATSMVDLATLRGLVPGLAQIPTVLYFHENQFVYPQQRQRHSLVDAQVTSIYAGLAADRLLFNSHYNRESFMEGAEGLLRKLPDKVPPGIVDVLRHKAAVLPVPLAAPEPDETPWWPGKTRSAGCSPLRLMWVGRFEHDKGGEGLLALLRRLELSGRDYEVVVTGQQFREAPPEFDHIRREFHHRLVQFGYIEEETRYRGLMCAADMVLSTALHEFQGLAVMEAVSRGCLPVVPDRLVYPEYYPDRWRYASSPDDVDREAAAAAARVEQLARAMDESDVSAPDLAAFQGLALRTHYEKAFVDAVAARDGQ